MGGATSPRPPGCTAAPVPGGAGPAALEVAGPGPGGAGCRAPRRGGGGRDPRLRGALPAVLPAVRTGGRRRGRAAGLGDGAGRRRCPRSASAAASSVPHCPPSAGRRPGWPGRSLPPQEKRGAATAGAEEGTESPARRGPRWRPSRLGLLRGAPAPRGPPRQSPVIVTFPALHPHLSPSPARHPPLPLAIPAGHLPLPFSTPPQPGALRGGPGDSGEDGHGRRPQPETPVPRGGAGLCVSPSLRAGTSRERWVQVAGEGTWAPRGSGAGCAGVAWGWLLLSRAPGHRLLRTIPAQRDSASAPVLARRGPGPCGPFPEPWALASSLGCGSHLCPWLHAGREMTINPCG